MRELLVICCRMAEYQPGSPAETVATRVDFGLPTSGSKQVPVYTVPPGRQFLTNRALLNLINPPVGASSVSVSLGTTTAPISLVKPQVVTNASIPNKLFGGYFQSSLGLAMDPLSLFDALLTSGTQIIASASIGVSNPLSIWGNSMAGAEQAGNPTITVGLLFKSTVNTYVTHAKFKKGIHNTGTHIGRLYTAGGVLYAGGGTLLGTTTFAGETASGMQRQAYPAPIPILANTQYIQTIYSPVGNIWANFGAYAAQIVNDTLIGCQQGEGGKYNNSMTNPSVDPAFPVSNTGGHDYGVDVETDVAPPQPPGPDDGVASAILYGILI
jgi:hypothetical protein